MVVAVAGEAIWRGIPIAGGNSNEILAQIGGRYRAAGSRLLDELEGPFAISELVQKRRS
jgi:hypothetical protein